MSDDIDPTVSDIDLAVRILAILGYATADGRSDRQVQKVAETICATLDPKRLDHAKRIAELEAEAVTNAKANLMAIEGITNASDKAVAELREHIAELEAENAKLRLWKQQHDETF